MDRTDDRLGPARRGQAQHQRMHGEGDRPGPGAAALQRMGQLDRHGDRRQQHQRRLRHRRPGDAGPAQPVREQQIEQDDAAEGHEPGRAQQLPGDEGRDLDARGRHQPERRQGDQQGLADFLAGLHRRIAAAAMDEEGAGDRRGGGHQAVEQVGVEDQRRHAVALVREQHRHAREHEQDVAEGARQDPTLAKADPHQAGGLERPGAGGAALVEGERNDQGQEDGGDRQAGIEREREHGALLHRRRQQDVEAGHRQRRERGAVLHVAHQPVLQGEDDRRQAEQQGAVDPGVAAVRAARRRAPRRQQHDQHEQEEEGDQEALAHRERFRPVAEHAPGGGDEEGGEEADQVERAPGPETTRPRRCRRRARGSR